ncbi:calcium-activated potassium channel subunit beta-4 [Lutra lutra]|nr:calcium-activated potassium channel subunit beta-4 [Lutra lutra]
MAAPPQSQALPHARCSHSKLRLNRPVHSYAGALGAGWGSGSAGPAPRRLGRLGPRRQTVTSLAGRGRAARGGSRLPPRGVQVRAPAQAREHVADSPRRAPSARRSPGNSLPTRPARPGPAARLPRAPAAWRLARSRGWLTNPGLEFKIPAAPLALRPLPVSVFGFNFHSGGSQAPAAALPGARPPLAHGRRPWGGRGGKARVGGGWGRAEPPPARGSPRARPSSAAPALGAAARRAGEAAGGRWRRGDTGERRRGGGGGGERGGGGWQGALEAGAARALLAPEGAGGSEAAVAPRASGDRWRRGWGRRRGGGAAAAGWLSPLRPLCSRALPLAAHSPSVVRLRRLLLPPEAVGSAPGAGGGGGARQPPGVGGDGRSSGWLTSTRKPRTRASGSACFSSSPASCRSLSSASAGSVPRCRICKPRRPTARCCRAADAARSSSDLHPVAPTAGPSQYPCVQVYVNNSESNSRALLHNDEHQLLTNPNELWPGDWMRSPLLCHSVSLDYISSDLRFFQCSYIPPCKRENQKNLESVMNWQQYWKDEIGSQPFTCYFNQFQRPDDVLLHRTHDEIVLLHCFLWPVVTFVVGVLIVVLTICAKSLAVKAEAMKKRKFS